MEGCSYLSCWVVFFGVAVCILAVVDLVVEAVDLEALAVVDSEEAAPQGAGKT